MMKLLRRHPKYLAATLLLALACSALVSLSACSSDAGPGPQVADDECLADGDFICDANRLFECRTEAVLDMSHLVLAEVENCALSGLVCHADPDAATGGADCIEPCTRAGAAECRTQGGGEGEWFVCAPPESTPLELSARLDRFLDEGVTEPTDSIAAWLGSGRACATCQSHCACQVGERCDGGFCIPGDVVNLVCCERERGGPCPDGEVCTTPDGADSVCDSGPRCESCETEGDCARGQCSSTAEMLGAVCLDDGDSVDLAPFCRNDAEVWSRDVCGRWVELMESCLENTRCIDGACQTDAPSIAAPAALDFGSTSVDAPLSLPLEVSNIGALGLNVSSIEVVSDSPNVFAVDPAFVIVAAGESEVVTVTFAPMVSGDFEGVLLLRSNDPEKPEVEVQLRGAAD